MARVEIDSSIAELLIDGASEMVETVCLKIEKDAKRYAPKDTGALIESIDHEIDGTVGRVYATADYAGYVEEGTRHMAAQPYLRPAALQAGGL